MLSRRPSNEPLTPDRTTTRRAIYGSFAATSFGQVALVLSGALAARMLGPENRGYLALLVLWSTVVFLLGGMGLPVAISYYIARKPSQARHLVRLALAPITMQVLGAVAAQGVLLIVLLARKPGSVQLAGLLTLALVPPSLGLDYALAILQGQRRFAIFNIFRPLPSALYACGVLGLFVFNRGDLVTVTAAWVLAWALASAGSLIVALTGLPTAGEIEKLPSRSELVSFGLRGLVGSAAPVETFRVDQAVVGLFLSPALLGLYVVGAAFTNLPRLIGLSFGMIIYPHVASRIEPGKASQAVWKFFVVGLVVSTLAAVVLIAAVGPLIPLFFGHEYRDAVEISRILLIGAALLAARRVLTDGARGMGQPMTGTVAEAASWLWLAPALIVLTPRLGVIGVALAFTSSAVVSLAVAVAKFLPDRSGPPVAPSGSPSRVLLEEN